MWGQLAIVFILVLINAFFAMAELAVVSARRPRLQAMAKRGSRGATEALRLAEDPTHFLSTVQIGITMVGVVAGAYSGSTLSVPLSEAFVHYGVAQETAQALAFGLVVVAVTYLSLVIGELVPKRIAIAYAEPLAVFVAPIMAIVARVGAPVVWFLRKSTEVFLKPFRLDRRLDAAAHEEEVKTLIAEGAAAGVFEKAEGEMMHGVMTLADRTVRAVMTPRTQLVWLNISEPLEVVRDRIAKSGHSRFLVAEGDIDHMLGVVQARDVLVALMAGQSFDLRTLVRDPVVVPDRTPVLRVLELFREKGIHLGVVVDEHGSIEGLITLTDILTEITGYLPEGRTGDIPQATLREDGSWLLDGRMDVHDAVQLLGLDKMAEDKTYTTLAGFILAQLGRIPEVADHFHFEGYRFEVVDMDERRIDKILVSEDPRP